MNDVCNKGMKNCNRPNTQVPLNENTCKDRLIDSPSDTVFTILRFKYSKLFQTIIILIGLIFTYAGNLQAASSFCVRAGASGARNGSNWNDAFDQLPNSLQRGATYYIADGNYSSYNFDDSQSGSTSITIKKATANDHGTATGWSSSYGDGQATFNSPIVFKTNNWVFDGVVRNENDWFNGGAYGFRINHNNKDQNIIVEANNITVKYVYINALQSLPGNTIRRYAVDTDSYGGATRTGLLFHRMYVFGSNNIWFLRTTNGATVEYSASSGARSNSTNHGEIWNLYYSGDNAVIRYNKVKDAYTGDWGTAIVAITAGGDNCKFYGNVIWDFYTTDGVFGYLGGTSTGNQLYNNTFVDGGGYNQGFALGSGNTARNNLWVNCSSVNVGGTQSNNVTNGATSVFKNYSGNDFMLSGNGSVANTGYALSSPYNVDLNGNTRGSNGGWSIGAYQYVGNSSSASSNNSSTNPTPPKNLHVVSP